MLNFKNNLKVIPFGMTFFTNYSGVCKTIIDKKQETSTEVMFSLLTKKWQALFLKKREGLYLSEEEINKFEQIILKEIEKDESLLTLQNEIGNNIGMYTALAKLEKVVLKALDNKEASVQQDVFGLNIRMYAAHAELEQATLKALDNQGASLQQDVFGRNIGMHAALHRLEKATQKALENKEANVQQNKYGENIEMYDADCVKLEKDVLKALESKMASEQKNKDGLKIEDVAKVKGIKTYKSEKEQTL